MTTNMTTNSGQIFTPMKLIFTIKRGKKKTSLRFKLFPAVHMANNTADQRDNRTEAVCTFDAFDA